MERFLLFIRDKDEKDFTDIHPSEASARRALIAYVRRREHEDGLPHPIDDDAAIASYFRDGALYAITRVGPPSR